MLCVISLAGGDLATLDFGQPVEPRLTVEERVRSILADFEARKAELIDIGFDEAVPALIQILETAREDPESLLPPIRALGYLGRPQGALIVGGHFGHRNAAVRLAVIRSLGQMGKFSSVPRIEAALNSVEPKEKREAIIALGKFANPEAVAGMELAAGQDPGLMLLVEEAKRRIQATVLGIDTGKFDAFVGALIDTGEYEDILPLLMMCWRPLKQILGDRARAFETRRRALFLLVSGAARKAGPEMRAIVGDPREELALRLEAVRGLGRTRARSAVPLLDALLDSDEPGMREASVEALGRIGEPGGLAALLRKWEAGPPALRPRLRLAISRLRSAPGDPGLLGPLRSYQPIAVREIYFITDSLQLVSGYRRDLIDPLLSSPLPEARRDALLLLASFGTRADSENLQRFRDTAEDPLHSEIAHLGIERLKDIPIWERP